MGDVVSMDRFRRPDRLVTAKELSEHTGLSLGKIRRLRREGMPSVNYGPPSNPAASVRFPLHDALAWLELWRQAG